MGSGLIYAVIVVLWAVVLVPMWLRRQDTEIEVRSVDRFSRAMGTLSRRPSIVESVADPESGSESGSVSKVEPLSDLLPPQVFVSRPRSARTRDVRARRLRMRRQILGAVGAVLVATGIASAAGVVGLWVPAVALGAGVVTAGVLRRQALVDESRARAERRLASRPRAATRGVTIDADVAEFDTVVLDRVAPSAPSAPAVVAEAVLEIDLRDGARPAWQPMAPPLPTYVTAPAATAVPRVIDRTGIGGLTAHRMVELAEAARTPSGIDAAPANDDVWSAATSTDRDAVFDREWFESGASRDGFADEVAQERDLLAHEQAADEDGRRRRHPSHDVAEANDLRRASGA